MGQAEQKTDSQEFAIANPTPSGEREGSTGVVDATDIAIRLWGFRGIPLAWKTDSVLIYMIADLVAASGGRFAEESPEILAAHFAGAGAALVAAKRIQTSILEFLACRPDERIGGAVLIYRPGGGSGLDGGAVRRALRLAKPGQILLAESIAQRMHETPGLEIHAIPALATAGPDELTNKLSELIWTTADRLSLVQQSADQELELRTGDVAPVGATVLVHSQFSRQGGANQAPKSSAATAFGDDSGGTADGLRPSRGTAFGRNLVLIGAVALALVAVLIVVLFRPSQVSKTPIPTPQDQPKPVDIPLRQPVANMQPSTSSAQTEPPAVKTEAVRKTGKPKSKAGSGVAQSQIVNTVADDRAKTSNVAADAAAAYPEESGGVSQKDIPTLLKMAQADAGAGNYDKARNEFRKILGLQPNNQDAKDGLHKLDIIQKDR